MAGRSDEMEHHFQSHGDRSPESIAGRERSPTGIPGLDDVLGGGLPPNRLYVIQGNPGVGKTTLALQYLLEGRRRGEHGLYVSLSETQEELEEVSRSHRWSLEGIHIHELLAREDIAGTETYHTIFHPAEVELTEKTTALLDLIDRVQPSRVVLDSLTELRLVAGDPLRFRRQILNFKHYLAHRKCTVLMLDEQPLTSDDYQLQSLSHGVVLLELVSRSFGGDRRRLRVLKVRGMQYWEGYHDFKIITGGIQVFPSLVPGERRQPVTPQVVSSGIDELDALLDGGLYRGSSTLLLGSSGVGKSNIASQYAIAAAERGERAVFYIFEESIDTIHLRTANLGMSLKEHVNAGRIFVDQIDPAVQSPGEFAHHVRHMVEEEGVQLVVLDSLRGYINAMPEERFMNLHLHELLTYLGQRNVTTFLVVGQTGLGGQANQPSDISYLADTVILLRHYEVAGEVRQAISVVKKRTGGHQRGIRELHLGSDGIKIGAPILEFRGILTGTSITREEGTGYT